MGEFVRPLRGQINANPLRPITTSTFHHLLLHYSLINQILRLTRNCLSYDFIGTSNDETTDDSSTIQIPTNWRPAFLDLSYLTLFFDLYHMLPSRLSSSALSTLVQVGRHNAARHAPLHLQLHV